MNAATVDLSALVHDLQQAGEDAPTTTDRVLAESAQMILTEMRQLTPVKTGRLKASETVQASPGRYTIGPVGVPYAGHVEFGTAHMAPRAYVRKAVEKYLDDLGPAVAQVGVDMIMGKSNA